MQNENKTNRNLLGFAFQKAIEIPSTWNPFEISAITKSIVSVAIWTP